MKSCDIHHIKHKDSFRWKWRHQAADGTVIEESKESYGLFYECVLAARERGYEPVLTSSPPL